MTNEEIIGLTITAISKMQNLHLQPNMRKQIIQSVLSQIEASKTLPNPSGTNMFGNPDSDSNQYDLAFGDTSPSDDELDDSSDE